MSPPGRGPVARWPQVTPSEPRRDSQKKADTPATSSSEPSAGATATPVTETPVVVSPVVETPVAETPVMGDSQSWAKRVEAGMDEEFQKAKGQAREASQVPIQEARGKTGASLPPPRQ